jgi:tetratricopeptide (TPR) repeat protein
LRWFMALFFVVIVVQTYSRVQEWSDKGVILTVAVNDHPLSSRARTEYANYLYGLGKGEETLEQLRIITELSPLDAGAVLHQLLVLCLKGERNDDLLAEAQERLKNWPVSVYGLNSINKLASSLVRAECKQIKMKDVEGLLLASLSQPGNLAHPANHASLLALMGLYKFTAGDYQQAVNLYLESYKLSGNLIFLEQLARHAIQFREYAHAEQFIAMIEEVNKKRFGLETYRIEKLNKVLAEFRQKDAVAAEVKDL